MVPCISNYKILTLWPQNFFASKNAHFVSKLAPKSPNLVVKLTSYERSLRNSDYQNRRDFCGTELASQKSRYSTCRDNKYLCTCQTPSYVRNLPKLKSGSISSNSNSQNITRTLPITKSFNLCDNDDVMNKFAAELDHLFPT